jgi:hypothetical protein
MISTPEDLLPVARSRLAFYGLSTGNWEPATGNMFLLLQSGIRNC